MHTAAIVSAQQIGDQEAALAYYDKALSLDPTFLQAFDEAIKIRREKKDYDGVEVMLQAQLEVAKAAQDRERIRKLLDQLGDLYRKLIDDPDMAIDAYEAAQAFDPDDRDRHDVLAELYTNDPGQYFDKAIGAQARILRRNPYKVETYKVLRKLYTEAKRGDAAWCLCQALAVLNLAEPDEERFYKKHRSDSAAAAQAVVDENDWVTRIAHADLDPLVTKIFAMIQPTILRVRARSLEAMGYEPRYAIDLTRHPYPVSQTLYYAHGVLGLTAPMVFENKNDQGGLGFVHSTVPSILLGAAAFDQSIPPQTLAYVAGRHITYFRPGLYVRHLVPTGTGLKAWLFATIKMNVPNFPIASEMQGQVQEAMDAIQNDFKGAERERLSSLVTKLLQSGGALDLKRWVAAVDFTADRAGFLLAHDLEVAAEVMRATDDDSQSSPVKERIKEIVLFGVSEEYFALRTKLQISID